MLTEPMGLMVRMEQTERMDKAITPLETGEDGVQAVHMLLAPVGNESKPNRVAMSIVSMGTSLSVRIVVVPSPRYLLRS